MEKKQKNTQLKGNVAIKTKRLVLQCQTWLLCEGIKQVKKTRFGKMHINFAFEWFYKNVLTYAGKVL